MRDYNLPGRGIDLCLSPLKEGRFHQHVWKQPLPQKTLVSHRNDVFPCMRMSRPCDTSLTRSLLNMKLHVDVIFSIVHACRTRFTHLHSPNPGSNRDKTFSGALPLHMTTVPNYAPKIPG
ncbi:uncharacterized protein H6S33_000227 [Morchella sextelata]|uniref:uncharacterized protein n=1 Tax=Morchella sextelata TaxID=1174677 RepID=UPI001D03F8B8|nr:uncharacterized protein H6S33_000227 [Morchella sextelata]KAH0614591.1 hypothetical protein H6S33_000227 [Morchella sextelata]